MFNQESENEVQKALWWRLVEWYFKEYDLTIEIKEDLLCEKTWNVAFEIKYNWEDSWVYWTKSNKVIYKVLWKYYIIDSEKLKLYLNIYYNSWDAKLTKWWDFNKSLLLLLPLKYFILIFKEINL